MTPSDIERLYLARLVSEGFSKLSQGEFILKYEAEVSDLEDLVIATHHVDTPNFGVISVYVLNTGLTVMNRGLKWSLYETAARAQERGHINGWAAFSRGHWTRETPTEPGLYFVRDADLHRRSVRELQWVKGRLLDVSGGLVPPGRVSTWTADWWSEAIPPLPNSY